MASENKNECHSHSIKKCSSVNRLLQILSFYSETKNEIKKEKEILLDYIASHCPSFLDDFAHVINDHINNGDSKKERDFEFSLLFQKVQNIISCNLSNCDGFTRHNRDRRQDSFSNHKTTQTHTQESNFLFDFLDSVHVLFRHSYDCGYRMRGYDLDTDEHDGLVARDDTNDDIDDLNITVATTDHQFEEMQNAVKDIQQKLKHISAKKGNNTNRRIDTSKFNNDIHDCDDSDDAELEEKTGKEQITNVNNGNNKSGEYSFGLRCYYWPFYENNSSIDCDYHPNETYSEWFVGNKYSNLKKEITQNPFECLSMDCYKIVHTKALHFLECKQIKKCKSDDDIKTDKNIGACKNLYYQMRKDSCIQLWHLIALMCYTDQTDFSYWFSKSFRKNGNINGGMEESHASFIKRKMNYHFLSKYLRELVELFGTTVETTKHYCPYNGNRVKNFYTGISKEVTFTSFCCRLYGPTSTTAQLSIATLFAKKNGLIVTLNMNKYAGRILRFWDCSLTSVYNTEDERLFIGGRLVINFLNIRCMKTKMNFISFINAISKMDMLLKCKLSNTNAFSKFDKKIVKLLVNHYIAKHRNKFPAFVNALFAEIMENKKIVKIDVSYFKKHKSAEHLHSMFIDKNNNKTNEMFIEIHYLCQICVNVERICLQFGDTVSPFVIDDLYLELMQDSLVNKLEWKKSNDQLKLKEIKVLNVKKCWKKKKFKKFKKNCKKMNLVASIEKFDEGYLKEAVECLVIKRVHM